MTTAPEPIWMCPVCERDLARRADRFDCDAGHSFDIAREGYVYLLLPKHRRSARAGDPVDSLRARRAFLEAGHYAPLAAALAEAVAAEPGGALLDVGCGEGWYLRQLAAAGGGCALHGVDVAREAVRLAARAAQTAALPLACAVGNAIRLPVRAAAVDVVLQVFAPAAPAEVRRVLRPGGRLLDVRPGPGHLAAFRSLVYGDDARPHAETPPPAGFTVVDRQPVSAPVALEGAAAVARLVAMTPYKWHVDPARAARLASLEELRDTAQFVVTVATPA